MRDWSSFWIATRYSEAQSFNAELPASWVASGLSVRVEVDPEQRIGPSTAQDATPSVGTSTRLEIVLVPVVSGTFVPPVPSAGAVLDELTRRFPIPRDRVVVTPPSHRVDIDRVADLYEEVIRHVGYDRVPAQLPVLSTSPGHRHPNLELVDRARGAAVGVGLAEVMTFAFIDPDDDALAGELPLPGGAPLPLANPLARTQSVMRRSLLPGLLAGARGNLNRGEQTLAIFEQGWVFFAGDGSPVERERLALVLAGTRDGGTVGFGELKGLVEELLDRISFPAVAWQRGGSPWLDEAEGTVLVAGDAVVGLAGLLAAGPASRRTVRMGQFNIINIVPLPACPSLGRDRSR